MPKTFRTFLVGEVTYRINNGIMEFLTHDFTWCVGVNRTREAFAERLVREKRWSELATFADICARPTEEA